MKPERVRRWIMLGLSAACAIATTVAAWHAHAQTPPPAPAAPRAMPYDAAADPRRDLQRALEAARREHKRVLVVFGANWSPDCRVLDDAFHAGGKTDALVASRFEVVHVDVGRFDRNLDFARRYGDPVGKGIPSVVVVTPSNQVVYQTKAGELADARELGADGIYGFFKEQVDTPAGS